MGIISALRKRKVDGDAEAMRRFALAKKRERDAAIEEAYKSVERVMVPARMVKLDFELDGLPFGNREYLRGGSATLERKTGKVIQESYLYYADDEALRLFLRDLAEIESMIDGGPLGIPSLPALRTRTSLLRPVRRKDDADGNNVTLSLHPLTKTGRRAKYPASVNFSAYERVGGEPCPGMNGSHGSVFYMQDGSVGKANAFFWKGLVFYGVYWKIVGGGLAVGSIEYSDDTLQEKVQIYSAG